MKTTHKLNVQGFQTAKCATLLAKRGTRTRKEPDERVTSRLDEVQTCVDSVVSDLDTVDAVLLLEIRIKAGLDVLDDRFPANGLRSKHARDVDGYDEPIVVVDEVTEAGRINNSETKANAILLNILRMRSADATLRLMRAITGAYALDSHSRRPLVTGSERYLGGIEGSIEEGVDESRFAEPGLTWTRRQVEHRVRRLTEGATRTNHHGGELEALPHALAVNLVGEIGETDVAHKFLAYDGRNARLGVRDGCCRAIGGAIGSGGKVTVAGGGVIRHLEGK